MEPWRRRTLTLHELLRYNADIICLQEVDEKAFQRYFEPQLTSQGVPVPSMHQCIKTQPLFAMPAARQIACSDVQGPSCWAAPLKTCPHICEP